MKDARSLLAWTRGERRQNRLLSAEPLSPVLGDKAVSFTYDGQGRRVTKMVEAWNGSAWIFLEKMRFTWDDWNLLEEEITTGGSYSLAKQYTWGIDLSGTMQRAGGVGGLVFIKDFSSADYAYHFDANGNVLQLTDSSGTWLPPTATMPLERSEKQPEAMLPQTPSSSPPSILIQKHNSTTMALGIIHQI